MAKTQKEISKRYEGNRAYYKVLHSFRRWKLWLATASLILGVGLVLIFALGFRRVPHLERFYNVGAISQSHAQIAHDCQQCHTTVNNKPTFIPTLSSNRALEEGCQHCHVGFNFHHANVVKNSTCISCHQEHMGNGPMKAVADTSCQSCHASPSIMAASRAMVLNIPSSFLEIPPPAGVVFFPQPRLPDGYTKVIHSFESDHPPFRIESEQIPEETVKEMDRLKFSHNIHMTGNIPNVDGHKLDCAYCHKLDSTRTYLLPVNYEVNCKACHSLQFDASLPNLEIPHPTADSDSVSNFLLTLPTQVEKYATEQLKMTDRNRVKDFVFQKMTALRERDRRGDDLIHDVFYSDNQRTIPGGPVGNQQNAGAYPGCAYCHTVETSATGAPIIPKPLVPDRWFTHGKFSHAKHATMNCTQCHGAILSSNVASQIALPAHASCVTCHSTKGGVTDTCVTCHDYHHAAPPGISTATLAPVRAMLLGGN